VIVAHLVGHEVTAADIDPPSSEAEHALFALGRRRGSQID